MKSGQLQYRLNGQKAGSKKEQNFVMPYKGYWQLIKLLFMALRKNPDAIFLFKK